MREFDPDWPARLHDRLNDKTIDWLTGRAPEWRAHAVIGADGWAYFDGLIFDGWQPVAV